MMQTKLTLKLEEAGVSHTVCIEESLHGSDLDDKVEAFVNFLIVCGYQRESILRVMEGMIPYEPDSFIEEDDDNE